jgi:hypothetical protein
MGLTGTHKAGGGGGTNTIQLAHVDGVCDELGFGGNINASA